MFSTELLKSSWFVLWVKGDLKNSEQPPTVPEMCGDTAAHPRIQLWEVGGESRAQLQKNKQEKQNQAEKNGEKRSDFQMAWAV